jgi:hypothetical protein
VINGYRVAIAAAALLLLAAPAQASGELDIPAFARKYRVSCTLCHAPAPRLTEFGERFAGNGFEFAPGEAPRDTVDTGDPLLRLQRDLPLAVRFDLLLSASTPDPDDRAAFDLQTPWGIKLLTGGQLAEKVSYYLYFYMSEHGEVAGLEDAYLQFTDLFGSGADLIVGQFQVSDPMFKRELRLEVLDYAPYRLRVGDVRADLTYDRGLMLGRALPVGDLVVMMVNGRGLGEANEFRLYDGDRYKNFAAHYSVDVGPVRLGAFGYYGTEEGDQGLNDEIVMYGPDVTVGLGNAELNVQYLRRTDDNPFFLATPPTADTEVDAAFVELIYGPQGPAGRLFFTGLYNHISADAPVFRVRLGEQEMLEEYRVGALGVSYLLERNLRALAEVGYDLDREETRFTLGATAAF